MSNHGNGQAVQPPAMQTAPPVSPLDAKTQALMAEVEKLRATNAKLTTQLSSKSKVTLRVSPKGGVMLLGINSWPVTLYKDQWHRILVEERERILEFIELNDANLKGKAEAGE